MKVKEFMELVEKHKLHDATVVEIIGGTAVFATHGPRGKMCFGKVFTKAEWLTEQEIRLLHETS